MLLRLIVCTRNVVIIGTSRFIIVNVYTQRVPCTLLSPGISENVPHIIFAYLGVCTARRKSKSLANRSRAFVLVF